MTEAAAIADGPSPAPLREPWLGGHKATIAAALLAKAGGIFYSVVVLAWAARKLDGGSAAEFFRLFNIMAAFGLAQAGLGGVVLRTVLHRDRALPELTELKLAAVLSASGSLIAVAVFGTGFGLDGRAYLIPLVVLYGAGAFAGIADSIRIGMGRSHVSNLYLCGAYAAGLLLVGLSQLSGMASPWWLAVLTYGVPYAGFVASFIGLLRTEAFRGVLRARTQLSDLPRLSGAIPILLVSVGSIGILNLPWLIHVAAPRFARFSSGDTVMLRLAIAAVSVLVSVLLALAPRVIRTGYDQGVVHFRRSMSLLVGGFLGAAAAASLAFLFFGPWAARVWFGHPLDQGAGPAVWALILFCWLAMTLFYQLAQQLHRASVVAVALVLVVTAPLGFSWLMGSLTGLSTVVVIAVAFTASAAASVAIYAEALRAQSRRLAARSGQGSGPPEQ